MSVADPLAYCDKAKITAVISFMILAPGLKIIF